MLKQSIEPYSEEYCDAPLLASNTAVSDPYGCHKVEVLSELEKLASAVAESEMKNQDLLDSTMQAFVDEDSKALSDIARRLTSVNRVESRINDFVSFLARIFGGGLGTSW